ncbi:hypothetical protein ANCCEY_02599 [Ancylostoma ceylanicum]|uniref:Nucleotide-diphospho-sugar transferase domain-containing protein n=1 Tax=Ancylostoma ceylanicum TaxID=53326 RepID=A0A0D6MC50_9BILA|nr:hypothetical protein ANCCEY_02599 [Ancylostoma ceylanicum]
MDYVRNHYEEVSFDAMMSSKEFKETLSALPPDQETFVLILNVHALNMTLNWLCNTEQLPGVHNQSLIVTMDRAAADALKALWPNVRQLHWPVPGLQKPFNYGDGPYQLFYLFRANLARTLLAMGKSFWMIQQDTFWAESLSSFNVAARTEDIIFDRASENGPMIAGEEFCERKSLNCNVKARKSGYYYAKPNPSSMAYFERLAQDISWWYAPDNAYMTSLCELSGLANCGGLPFSLITNWQWLDSKSSNSSPSFVQFDGETNLGGKLGKMKQLGFYFLQEDGRSCNRRSVEKARQLLSQRMSNWSQLASSSQQQFKFYQNVIDRMYSNPWTSWFLNRWMLPYGHYCMLSF